MKRLLVVLAIVCNTFAANAQLELGVNGGFGTTWFLNDNAFDQGPNLNPNFSFGGSYGISSTYYFTETIGIGVEANMLSMNQKYDGTVNELNFDSRDHVNYFQLPIMLKVKTESGFYFEAGPEINFLSRATGELTSADATAPMNYADREIKTGFNNNVFGVVFGFGGRFNLNENLLLTAGLRFYGGIADATEELGEEVFQNEWNEENLGTTVFFAHTDQGGNYYYEKTTLATGGVQVGLVYLLNVKK